MYMDRRSIQGVYLKTEQLPYIHMLTSNHLLKESQQVGRKRNYLDMEISHVLSVRIVEKKGSKIEIAFGIHCITDTRGTRGSVGAIESLYRLADCETVPHCPGSDPICWVHSRQLVENSLRYIIIDIRASCSCSEASISETKVSITPPLR